MSSENLAHLTWWDISKFRKVGAQKLPVWHGVIYLAVAIATWAVISFVFSIPKLNEKEFGDSLSVGFVFTFYGYIFYTFSCFRSSYKLIKSNNLARPVIVWLGCWSVLGTRIIIIGGIPLLFLIGLIQPAFPYNMEDILFISYCLLLVGVHLSVALIERVFELPVSPEVNEDGAIDNA